MTEEYNVAEFDEDYVDQREQKNLNRGRGNTAGFQGSLNNLSEDEQLAMILEMSKREK